jgi:hypothetical protein
MQSLPSRKVATGPCTRKGKQPRRTSSDQERVSLARKYGAEDSIHRASWKAFMTYFEQRVTLGDL